MVLVMLPGGPGHRKCAFILAVYSIFQASSLVVRQDSNSLQSVGREVGLRSDESCVPLINAGSHFTVEVLVGTPPQRFELVADTGSDAVIVQSCLCRNYTDECKEEEDCFMGTNRSSTFVNPKPNGSLRHLTFGSGEILCAVATDVVQVGEEKSLMKDGLLLMLKRRLDFDLHFEGILGLGVPSWIEEAGKPPMATDEQAKSATLEVHGRKAKNNETGKVEPSPRFIEEADVNRFSICMNDAGQPGVMRLQPPAAPKMLKQIGQHHWSLDFRGLSVGSSTAAVAFCDPASKEESQITACSMVPDSGTTLILGPQKQLDDLFVELCNQWPRCKEDVAAGHGPEVAFRGQLHDCKQWMDQGQGLNELPTLFLHAGSADGEAITLELSPWSYVTETKDYNGNHVCEPLLGAFEYHTSLHGPVWIFGTPMFYEYQVIFAGERPDASLGFSDESCGSCGMNTSLVLDSGLKRGQGKRIPRVMHGPKRMPSIDPSKPL